MSKTITKKVAATVSVGMALLMNNKAVGERAESYYTSIKRSTQRDVIDALQAKKEAFEDKLFELKDFTLDTDKNKGMHRMTKEDCEARFKEIIETEYKLELLTRELEIKSASFNKYFGDVA